MYGSSIDHTENDGRLREPCDKKSYINAIHHRQIVHLNSDECVSLTVHYNSLYPARYHKGLDLITQCMGGAQNYLGTPRSSLVREYFFKLNDQDKDIVLLNADRLAELYNQEIELILPWRDTRSPYHGQYIATPQDTRSFVSAGHDSSDLQGGYLS